MQRPKRIKSGVSGLDRMFNTGPIKGSITLVGGRSGAGKTLLGLQFIKQGLQSKEICVFISYKGAPGRTLGFYNLLNFPWGRHIKNKKLILIFAGNMKKNELFFVIKRIISKKNIDRILIDGITLAKKDKTATRKEIENIINLIEENKISAVLTAPVYEEKDYFGLEESLLPELADNLIILKHLKQKNEDFRYINIIKAKGTFYDTKAKKIIIGNNGLYVEETIEDFDNENTEISIHPEFNIFNDLLSEKGREDSIRKHLMKKYPGLNIRVKENLCSSSSILNKVKASDVPSDVIYLNFNALYDYASKGLLLELDSYFDKADYFEGAVKACSFNGKLYGVPGNNRCRCLMYRKDLLDKYKMKVPETWDEVINAVKIILNKEQRKELTGLLTGWNNLTSLSDEFFEFMWSNGVEFSGKKVDIELSYDKILKSLQFMQDLIYKYKIISEKNILGNESENYREQKFLDGEAIFYLARPNNIMREIYNTDSRLKGKIWLASLPMMKKSGKAYKIITGAAFCIAKNAKYPEPAISYIKYYFDEISKDLQIKRGWTFPSKIAFLKDKEILRANPYYTEMANIMKGYRIPIQEIENYNLISLLLKDKIFQVLKKEVEPAAALKYMNDCIKRFKRHGMYSKIAQKIADYIENNYDKKMLLGSISKEFKLSACYLQRIFKLETGETMSEYIMKLRIEKSKEFLKDIKYNITEAGRKVGYLDLSQFGKIFKKHTGLTPNEFRLK